MAAKNIKGVIRNWTLADEWGKNELRIHGICVMHTTYEGHITQNHPMTTSPVLRMWSADGVRYCETKNSIYILL